ncbi:hypothetical protein PMAYCL1PPCAC_08495, partial [Pristionchus mayeri]
RAICLLIPSNAFVGIQHSIDGRVADFAVVRIFRAVETVSAEDAIAFVRSERVVAKPEVLAECHIIGCCLSTFVNI